MEIEVITLLKVPVKVMCFGGVTPSRIVKNPELKPSELVLVIPGNPGLVEFYPEFGARIFEKAKKPVWIISHGGHEDLPSPRLNSHPDLYTLQGQLRQKQELIDTYLRGVKLRCVGHSIGCKMLLDLLKSGESYASQIESAYLFFPTIERMATTPNGEIIQFVDKYLYWPIMVLLTILNILPNFLKKAACQGYLLVTGNSLTGTNAVMKFLEQRVVRNVIYLADDEMKNVVTRDDDVIKKYEDRLRFYYSATDGWTPLEYFEDLKKTFPNIRAEVDTKGIVHCFVFNHAKPVADIAAGWLLEEDK